MTKQILGGALVLGLVSLGAGLWAGRTILRADGDSTAPASREAAGDSSPSRAEYERLKAEHARTVEALRAKEAEALRAREALAAVERAKAASPDAPAAKSDAASSAASAKAGADAGLDWSKFADLLAGNLDLAALAIKDEHQLTPEQQAKMAEFLGEFIKLAAKAKTMTDVPFFDGRVLPDYVQALFAKSLGLDEAQRAKLDAATRAALERETADLDPRTALPVQTYQARQRLIASIIDAVNGLVDDDQRARWSMLQDVSQRLMHGDESIGDIGMVDGSNRAGLEETVYDQWNWAYSFDESQQPVVRRVASTYTQEAERLLRDYGQWGPNARALSPAEQSRLWDDLYLLQFRMENEFQHLLTPEQREALRRRPPAIIRFHWGSNTNTQRNSGNGF